MNCVSVINVIILSTLLSMAIGQYGVKKHPCTVVLDEMRFAGYLARDCTYMDPFVYWRIEHRMSWNGARTACQQVAGGELVSVHSYDEKKVVNSMSENNFVSKVDQSGYWPGFDQGVWIGLVDQHKNGAGWVWSDDSVVDYTDWLSEHPVTSSQRGGDHCAQSTSYVHKSRGAVAFGWANINCAHGLKAICKTPRIAVYP